MKNPKKYKSAHIWYLYRQAFYGFIDHLVWSERCKASELAQSEYRKLFPKGDIRTQKWADQPRFDKGRQGGKFHFEHVFSGDMFREAVERLPKQERTYQNISRIVQKNYYVAWILKEENKLLPVSSRGKNIEDAFSVYEKCGIKLQLE